MSDEIDIEEHDVMDNPSIKRIFPDLSVIKKEINQYYDEALNASSGTETAPCEDSCQEEAPVEDSCQEEAPLEDSWQEDAITRESETQLPKHIQNRIELVTTNTFHASEATETQNELRYLHQNIIILGSKPTLQCQENNYLRKEPKLILKNVNSFLKRCKRYCKECLILFPKAHLFNLHVINIHTKRNNQIAFMGRKVGNNLFKCNACDRFLSSQNNLLRHFKNLHGDVKALKTVDRSDKKIVANEASQKQVITGLSCFHCQQLFPTQSSLIEHLYEVLEPKKIGANDKSTKSSTDAKEPHKEVNLNDRLKEGECVNKHLNESNVNHKNNRVAISRPHSHSKADKDNGDSERILPQKQYLRRRSLDNVVGLAECDENIPKKKLKTNFDPLQNGDTKIRKRLKTKECNECKKLFNSKKELKYHIRSIHTERSNNRNKSKSNTGKAISNFQHSKKSMHSKFYKCFICSKYNVTFEFYSRHVTNDHKIKEVTEAKKVPFDSQCKFCPSKPSGIYSYNVHLFKYHKKQLKGPYFPREEQPVNKNHEKLDKKVLFASKNILYKCMKCDLFFLSSNAAMDHSEHLRISDTWKCPDCLRIFRSENMTLHEKQHTFSQSFTVHTLPASALSQVLYKCSNCTVHYSEENFLLHYLKCDSETPNSLYCKVCDILINRDDMECHGMNHKEKQIQCCDFIIIESDMIDDRDINTNTAKTKNDKSDVVHDRNISINTAKTNNEKSDMVNNRPISTNTGETKNDKSHMIQDRNLCTYTYKTRNHKSVMLHDRHITPNTAKSKNGTVKKTRLGIETLEDCSKFIMNFCDTCKCFIGNVNLRKLHVEGKCGHMLKYVCKDCGLMLTTKIHATHKEYHKKEQISLHDYVFYDLKSEKRICPPIPDYPKCNSCGVHFLRNCDIRIHSCQEQDYITCNVCSMKLTEHAYKLHIHFHSYVIPSVNTKLKETALPANEIAYVEPNLSVSDDAYIINVMTFYTCKSCQLTVNTYDKVVQHCQDHYDSKVVQLNMHKCQKCTLILHRNDYENHIMLHLNGKYNKDSIIIVDFDPFYFRYNNVFWTKHIFAYVADEDISKILRNSIYRYECRLKMEKIQSGSSNSELYRCDKCQVFVDPQYLYIHAVNSGDKSCVKLRKHPCALCGLSFSSLAYRIAHEKEHESVDMNLKSYKIVLYNKEEHETYNNIMYDASNRYILYQCRNCEAVVDKFERNAHKCDDNNLKICSICGLLLGKQDFDLHSIRHEELDKFNVENIIVVMFGKLKLCYLGKKKLRSTFSGTKYDYTMYKCKKCDLCFRTKESITKHVCVFDTSKCECSKCGLFFSKTDLKCHHKFHEINLDIDDLNMNIITFDASSAILHVDPKDKLGENNDLIKQTEEFVENTSYNPEKQDIIYKCDCGLHFLEELNAQQHANICNARIKISKQSCIKCDLLFTPGELFNHLLKHHYDKKLQFKFDVVLVSKNEKK